MRILLAAILLVGCTSNGSDQPVIPQKAPVPVHFSGPVTEDSSQLMLQNQTQAPDQTSQEELAQQTRQKYLESHGMASETVKMTNTPPETPAPPTPPPPSTPSSSSKQSASPAQSSTP